MLLTSDDTRTLIDELFAEQQRLAAVERFAQHCAGTNQLTPAAFDPYSRQPAYKACTVQVELA